MRTSASRVHTLLAIRIKSPYKARVFTDIRQMSARGEVGDSCHQLYMLVNDCKELNTKTFIGHAVDVERALQQHNNEVPGGPRVSRKAAGHWTLALRIVLPSKRKLAHDALVEFWKRSRRKASRRLEFGISMAKRLQVPWFLNSALLDNTTITSAIPHVVRAYRRQRKRLDREKIESALLERFKRRMDAEPESTNSQLIMRTGRKRERQDITIDFSRLATGALGANRLKLLRKRGAAQNARGMGQPGDAESLDDAAAKRPRKAAHARLGERETLLSHLWLKAPESSHA